MARLMAVLLDNIAQIEFDRSKQLPDYQGAYLDKMDQRMDTEGIDLDGARVQAPSQAQKAQFIAANLANAIVADNESQAAAFTTYLAVRLPELKQVKIRREGDDGFAIELDFEHDYIQQQPVQFMPLKH
ncbi:hypothetical protein [uncultured Thiohalocapsa sp.]|uniref:hypothetical protein n=1 Tax=uncultured Thiohalocapsa sp. TaxID=768990 RepID=UPI0025DB9567|nr:hypothetical protein [uncultured Thiohalocapsa sp.]